jgi:polyphosphate kinase
MTDLPFDGAITRYFEEGAPKPIRKAIEKAGKDDIITPGYPYAEEMKRKTMTARMEGCSASSSACRPTSRQAGKRVIVVFEGRDAAGKGGTIGVMRENLNPRVCNVVALSKPSDREAASWYFQRYVDWLPARGEMAMFDRSWYNRAMVEHVFGFCTPDQRETFLPATPGIRTHAGR